MIGFEPRISDVGSNHSTNLPHHCPVRKRTFKNRPICGQSYKISTIVICKFRVVNIKKLQVITTVES